jgi:predicted transcriptional regulator
MGARAAWAALAALLLAAPGAAATVDLQADFARPAQATGDLQAGGLEWVALLFHGAPDTAFDLAFAPGAALGNRTILQADPLLLAGENHLSQPTDLSQSSRLDAPVRGQLGFSADPWSSLIIFADAISLRVAGAQAALDHAEGVSEVSTLEPRSAPESAFPYHGPDLSPLGGTTVAAQAKRFQDHASFWLNATGVHRVVWHNATLSCSTPACLDPGRPVTHAAMPGKLLVQQLSYIDVFQANGTLAGAGRMWAVVAGGPRPDLAVDGVFRLPDAHFAGTCPDGPCPDPHGSTFRATGRATLTGLAPDPSDPTRLKARLRGTLDAAAFDEASTAAFTVPTAAAVGVALVGLGLLAKVLVGLFARSARPPALQHRRRQDIHDLVRAQPGLSFREIQRRLGIPNGPLQNHVKRLLEERLIVAQPYLNTVRYFENHGRYDATWRGVAHLQDPDAQRLHAWVQENPGQTQVSIIAQAQAWGWSRAATQRRLRGLVDAGLLQCERQGRTAAYTPAPVPEQAAAPTA